MNLINKEIVDKLVKKSKKKYCVNDYIYDSNGFTIRMEIVTDIDKFHQKNSKYIKQKTSNTAYIKLLLIDKRPLYNRNNTFYGSMLYDYIPFTSLFYNNKVIKERDISVPIKLLKPKYINDLISEEIGEFLSYITEKIL